MIVLRRRLQAFYDCEEEDLREIVFTIVAILSTLQRRSVWVRNSQTFTVITASWDGLECKRKFPFNRATIRYLSHLLHTRPPSAIFPTWKPFRGRGNQVRNKFR